MSRSVSLDQITVRRKLRNSFETTQLSSRGVTECRAEWWLLRWWRLARRHWTVQQSSPSATYSPRFIWCAIVLQRARGHRFLSHLTSPFYKHSENMTKLVLDSILFFILDFCILHCILSFCRECRLFYFFVYILIIILYIR